MSGSGAGESDLATLLRSLAPVRDEHDHVFVTHAAGALGPHLDVVATVSEAEGTTSILRASQLESALAAGARCDDPTPMARLTLQVHSALSAVGLTAAVATALAARGISCNVVAGYHHDHLFVPAAAADRALEALAELTASAGG